MRVTTLVILIFLLTAFAIGVAVTEEETSLVHSALDNASISVNNFTITGSDVNYPIPNINGFFLIVEKYVHFVATFALEVMRAGIIFGHDNPNYFTPEFIISLMKFLVIIFIISLLIKPGFYLIVFTFVIIIGIKDSIIRRRVKKNEPNTHK